MKLSKVDHLRICYLILLVVNLLAKEWQNFLVLLTICPEHSALFHWLEFRKMGPLYIEVLKESLGNNKGGYKGMAVF